MAATQLIFILVQLSTITITINTGITTSTAATLPKFPAILVFGDSTVDTGNNNFVPTLIRANHLPYGQGFPGHVPTGRFSNGKLIPDFIAGYFGIKETVPPYLDPNLSNNDLQTGVCFASAGSGYDDLTTAVSGAIPFSKQLDHFKEYIGRLNGVVGVEQAKKIISEALVMLSSGTNDFILNYYDIPSRREQFNISGYQDFLQTALQNYIKELYNQGCRQMVVAGLPPIGCLPIQITINFSNPINRKCLEDQNSDSQAYNQKLMKLLTKLQGTLPGSRIVYADVYETSADMVNNPQKYGEYKQFLMSEVLQKQTKDAAGQVLWKQQAYVIQILQHVGQIPSSYFGIASIRVKQLIRTSPNT
ncbi:hypothetical protein JRO89_XS13G0213200 [Xanthoceras sorbifolium]|uniref:Uncharacterized protein n=1 Tax=Xanthoceras sorbifolium TaxID=99658 RepID=A0ABQ8H9E3_9ROSI|nr:hypothetical protein JRO89_XS13G0213200 [Xanthoceras sorbifolium]